MRVELTLCIEKKCFLVSFTFIRLIFAFFEVLLYRISSTKNVYSYFCYNSYFLNSIMNKAIYVILVFKL